MAWKGVITNAGQSLLDQWAAGGHTLTIEGATVGSGVREEANLRIATALVSEEDDASIVKSEAISGGTRIKVQISPSDSEGYTAHEVGVWAHLDSGERTLLAIHQDSGSGVDVPTRTVSPDFVFALYLIHAISNNETLIVNIDPSAFVSQTTLDSAVESLEAADDAIVASLQNTLGDFAAIETSPTTNSHAKGEYIIYNECLYRVTAAIAAGAALVEGTNVVKTTVGAEVKALTDGKVNTSAIANDLTTTASGKVLDARQGKTLKDSVDELNSKFKEVTVAVTIDNVSHNVVFRKVGKLCTVTFVGNIETRAWGAYETLTICNIPTGFVPSAVYGVVVPTDNRQNVLRGVVRNNGIFTIYNPGGAISLAAVSFSLSYPID